MVKLEAQGGTLSVQATNLEIGIVSTITGQVEEEGMICVEGKVLLEYIRSLPSGKVTLETKEQQLLVTGEKDGHGSVQGMGVEEFPVIPEVSPVATMVCRSGGLREVLEKTVFSASVDESRPEIHGVYLRVKDEMLIGVGTDSYRLAEWRTEVLRGDLQNGVIIPLRTCQEIVRMLPSTQEEVRLDLGETQLGVSTVQTTITSRIVEGNFPDYEQILPERLQRK